MGNVYRIIFAGKATWEGMKSSWTVDDVIRFHRAMDIHNDAEALAYDRAMRD